MFHMVLVDVCLSLANSVQRQCATWSQHSFAGNIKVATVHSIVLPAAARSLECSGGGLH